MTCEDVRREVSNYLDHEVAADLRCEIEAHLKGCQECSEMLEETSDIVQALGDERLIDVPSGYTSRLYRKLKAQLNGSAPGTSQSARTIPLGITSDEVELGKHLIYFWQDDQEFARGVTFLVPGLMGDDHCIVFGHDEATAKVFQQLADKGFDVPSLCESRRITLLRREAPAGNTLSDIEDVFKAAVRAGAPAIRYLGNLGVGKAPLPGAGIDDVLELEAKATALAKRYPVVVVCMYDVNSVPGRLILKGGFQTHPLAICGQHLTHNPYYIPEDDFLRQLHHR